MLTSKEFIATQFYSNTKILEKLTTQPGIEPGASVLRGKRGHFGYIIYPHRKLKNGY